MARALLRLALRVGPPAAVLFLAMVEPALAHDCSSPRDCEQTAGYNAVLALAGGALALAAGLFGNAIGGGSLPGGTGAEAGAEGGGEGAGETTLRKRRGCCLGWFSMAMAVPIALALFALRLTGLIGG